MVRKRSVAVEPVTLDDRWDKAFKPGLYEQVSRFLAGRFEGFCTVEEQAAKWDLYSKIAGYAPA